MTIKTNPKPKYTPESENKLWHHINTNQEAKTEDIATKFNMDLEDIRKLRMLWGYGDRESFNQAYYSLFEGSPTKF